MLECIEDVRLVRFNFYYVLLVFFVNCFVGKVWYVRNKI